MVTRATACASSLSLFLNINEKFLDIQTSSGREIYLSHNPMDYVGDGSYYSKEVQYLMDNGYRFIKEGEVWHAIR